ERVALHGARAVAPRARDEAARPHGSGRDATGGGQARGEPTGEGEQRGGAHEDATRSEGGGDRDDEHGAQRGAQAAGRGGQREDAAAAPGVEALADDDPEREVGGGGELLAADQGGGSGRARRDERERGEAGDRDRGGAREAREDAA